MGCAHGFKFSDEVTHYLYEMSLDGFGDDWTGDVDSYGWYHVLFLGPFDAMPDPPIDDNLPQAHLTQNDLHLLANCAGAILTTDGQGFVDSVLVLHHDKLMFAWDEVQQRYQDSLGPDDEAITSTDGLHWYYNGRQVLTIRPDDDRDARLRSFLDRQDWGADVWLISDHGNALRLNIWED